MSDFLADLRPEVERAVEERKRQLPVSELHARVDRLSPPQDVLGQLQKRRRPFLIAEFKRASPSAGTIAEDADLERVIGAYETSGAAMVSVLTEGRHFHGSLADIERARTATRLPILRKDFLLDSYQLLESRAAGADAVLLIAAFLPGDLLGRLLHEAMALSLTPFVEVHDETDLRRALEAKAPWIGVNNRNLRTLRTDLRVAENLLPRVPRNVLTTVESGLVHARDLRRAVLAGADGALIGESLMRRMDPGAAVRTFAQASGMWVKLCGFTRREDVLAAARAGADAVGFVLADSPRRVTPEAARQLGELLGPDVERVGVFADRPSEEVAELALRANLTAVQLHGMEPPEAVEPLREAGMLVLKGMSDQSFAIAEGARAAEPYTARGAVVLFDGRCGPRPDGLGAAVDDATVRQFSGRRFVLAGALTVENVTERLRTFRPAGVDVSRGVERALGVKDPFRMSQFVRLAKEA